jgi:signal recognition particle subunit SEC65
MTAAILSAIRLFIRNLGIECTKQRSISGPRHRQRTRSVSGRYIVSQNGPHWAVSRTRADRKTGCDSYVKSYESRSGT